MVNKLSVLSVRPQLAGDELASFLTTHGILIQNQPLFDYQKNATEQDLESILSLNDEPFIAIFVSVAAVHFAEQIRPIKSWQCQRIIAVGGATQQALFDYGIKAHCPEYHDSEGVLALAELQCVQSKPVVIVRGDGGRELIAQVLRERGALLNYFESYRRVWRKLPKKLEQQWKQQQINCIVVTSTALLSYLYDYLDTTDSYWCQNCYWLVASERIASIARNYNLARVVNIGSASKQELLASLQQLIADKHFE